MRLAAKTRRFNRLLHTDTTGAWQELRSFRRRRTNRPSHIAVCRLAHRRESDFAGCHVRPDRQRRRATLRCHCVLA